MDLVSQLGSTVHSHSGSVDVASLASNDVVGLYFSAHWCPPCRAFTPVLVDAYKKIRAQGKKFEVVFISSDRDEKSFDEYFKNMPWLSLPFDQREQKEELAQRYSIRGIPTLILVNGTGKTITADGRGIITNDPTGKGFPWCS